MHDAHNWWRADINFNGPSAVVSKDGSRRITIPLRPDMRRDKAVAWSVAVAGGLLAQLNGPSRLSGGCVWQPKPKVLA